MNKTAIKNFAIWARNKLIADITYKAGLLGISEKEIKNPLPQSSKQVQFFDIGTKEPYSISSVEIDQRKKLVETIEKKARQSDYQTAYKAVVEEVAYTWFNRLIAVRFMEVNDYLPSRIRVLSSESATKTEPDLVTTPFDTDLEFTPYEKDRVVQLTHDNQLDELFRMLFIKQCNALNAILPNLFEKTNDYTELLLNVSFTDKDGVVYHLVHDINEKDFRIKTEADEEAIKRGDLSEEDAPSGQVEIIGWMYQYYNTEPKDEAFALLKKNVKITKERIPAATQLFTPDWIVRYMVENSLGRLWLERERASSGLSDEYLNSSYFGWKYYLEEAEQEPEVKAQLAKIREEYKNIKPEDIKVIDPCMGSGHILVCVFDVLMQIYESYGYSQRDAAKSIVAHNIYGLDIDNRAYQMAYFAVMMKARQYNRRILNGETDCHVYSIQESNGINCNQLKYFGAGMDEMERNTAMLQMQGLLDTFIDAKEYGSILNVENYNWELLYRFVGNADISGQMTMDTIGIEDTKEQLSFLVEIGATMAHKYDVVVTNPPYLGIKSMNVQLASYLQKNFFNTKNDICCAFIERCAIFAETKGYYALIVQQAFLFTSSYAAFRASYLKTRSIVNMLQLGLGSFGADFGTVSFVSNATHYNGYISTCMNLANSKSVDTKRDNLLLAINSRIYDNIYCLNQDCFFEIPGNPITFTIGNQIRSIFASNSSLSGYGTTRQGLATSDNDRFIRLWQEVSYERVCFSAQNSQKAIGCGNKWFPFNKGGAFRRWYGNKDYVVNWENNGREMKALASSLYGSYSRTIKNESFYFLPAVTWSDITSAVFSGRYYSEGSIFSTVGLCLFANKKTLFEILGYLNSVVALKLLSVISPTIHYNSGDMANLPFIPVDNEKVYGLVSRCIDSSQLDWDSFEISWDFVKHPLLRGTSTIIHAFDQWQQFTADQFDQLKANEEKLNRIFIDIYGLQDELTPEVEDKDVTIRKADLGRDIRSFVSYSVGCMFGRYSLDVDGLIYAGGTWDDSKYITFIPDKDNILPITDEDYFEDDIVGLFVSFIKKTFGAETLEKNLDFIAKALGNKGNTAREVICNYFVKDFFKDHCKIYQKRPIYWLFDSGKADGFKALIYMHRYDENTIGNLRIDYLHRMQRVYDSEIARMQETVENSGNAREVTAAEKRKEKLTKQLKETKEYDEKIAHLALARITIDLDDGVVVNYEKVQTGTDGKKLDVLAKI